MTPRILFVALSLLGSVAQATDLLQAWQAAAGHDPQWLADQSSGRADAQYDAQGRSFYLPKVGVRAGVGQGQLVQNTEGAHFATPNMASDQVQFSTDLNNASRQFWGVELRQPVLDAAAFANATQLQQQAKAGGAQLELKRQMAMLRLADSYFGVLAARASLRALETQLQATSRALDVATARYRNGDIPITEQEEASARLALLQAQLLASRQQVELAEQRYVLLTGESATRLSDLSVLDEKSGLDAGDLAPIVAQARQANPQIAMSQASREATRAEVEKYRSWKSPKLELVAQAGEDRWHAGSALQNGRQNYIGLEVNIPIFTGGYRSAKLEESLARSDASEYQLAQTGNAVEDMARASWLGLRQGMSRIKALQLANSAIQRQLDATQLGHDEGARTLLDVLNVQQAKAGLESELAQTRYQTALAWLQLQAARGQLDINRIMQLNQLLR